MCLVESQDICLVETQDMCCVGNLNKPESQARAGPGPDRISAHPGRACPAIENVRKTFVKCRFGIKSIRFPLVFVKCSYGDLTCVGTSAAECTFLRFHLKYLILYQAFMDMCIFKKTFYEAFLTVAMQK